MIDATDGGRIEGRGTKRRWVRCRAGFIAQETRRLG